MNLRRAVALAVALGATIALSGVSVSGAACRTPEPYRPARGDQRQAAGPADVRHGPSWTGQPGRHAGLESGSNYLFADGSQDGALIEASAQGISMHAGVPDGGIVDFCLST